MIVKALFYSYIAFGMLTTLLFILSVPTASACIPGPCGQCACHSGGSSGGGGGGGGGGAAATGISQPLVNICVTIRDIIGLLAIVLFILGGTMYAIAHLLPAAGNIRGNVQGWSLGMIMGSIVGLILVLMAPQLISLIVSASGSTTITTPTLAAC